VVFVIAIGFPGSFMLLASAANAQEARTAASMAALKDKTAKLGAPKIQGIEEVGGKSAPALYFGSTKMNNNFTVVDEVAKEGGPGMVATLFVKVGVQQAAAAASEEYIRVATSVPTSILTSRLFQRESSARHPPADRASHLSCGSGIHASRATSARKN